MKRDFEKEYQEYMKNNTPDLWERIEAGLTDREAPAEKEPTAESTQKKQYNGNVYYRHRTLFRLLPAAACICILAAAALIPGLHSRKALMPEDAVNEPQTVSEADAGTGSKTDDATDAETDIGTGSEADAGTSSEADAAASSETDAAAGQEEEQEVISSEAGAEVLQDKGTVLNARSDTDEDTGESTGADTAAENTATVTAAENTATITASGSTAAAITSEDAADYSMDMAVPEAMVDITAPVGGETGSMIAADAEEFVYEDIGYWEESAAEVDAGMYYAGSMMDMAEPEVVSESYAHTDESGFCLTASQPVSTFSADVDTASYANVRRMIEDGWSLRTIYPDSVRTEEFINYFHYDLNLPEGEEPFGVTTEMSDCPWNKDHQLLMIGLQTEEIDLSEAPAENLVFLLDVSGSMADEDKLPLLQRAFSELTAQLDDEDTVSIVTYANDVKVVLEGVKGSEREAIQDAVEALAPEGGTYGEGGIQKAYALAERYFLPDGNNRILLATDGDLNIGISEPEELEKLIRKKRESGVYLSVLGFGTGNVRDDNMERLADCGNGNYSYIDSILEARKVLVEELGATFHTVAEDVKLQIEFNPQTVNAYRQLGYENRQLNAVDFADDTKDAGEIGAGHSMVVLYELIPAGSDQAVELKYQSGQNSSPASTATEETADRTQNAYADEFATLKIRYKKPGQKTSIETETVIDRSALTETPGDDFTFASLVAEFAMVLKDSPNKGTSSLEEILAACADLDLKDEYRQEFCYLVRLLLKREA